MDTQNPPLPPEDDYRPYDQQERAATAQPNPNDPIIDALSPKYGEFGGVTPSAPLAANHATPPGRSGANDNPDEFSEFKDREKDAQRAPDNIEDQPGHIMQNQATELVREVEASGADNEELRTAWTIDDPRYAGGGTHNTREESASTKDGQE
jgi:hypothetical protein